MENKSSTCTEQTSGSKGLGNDGGGAGALTSYYRTQMSEPLSVFVQSMERVCLNETERITQRCRDTWENDHGRRYRESIRMQRNDLEQAQRWAVERGRALDVSRRRFADAVALQKNRFRRNRVFHAWIRATQNGRRNRVIEAWFHRHQCLVTSLKPFTAWRAFLRSKDDDDDENENGNYCERSQIRYVARELIERYEDELHRVRTELERSQQELTRCHDQRKHIDNQMRQTILQGMTAMNTKALQMLQQK